MIKPLLIFRRVSAVVYLLLLCSAHAQTEDSELTWPRVYESKENRVVVYQPQIDSWTEHRSMLAKAAVVVEKSGEKAVYGGIFISVDTEINAESRTVLLKNLKIKKIVIAGVDQKQQKKTRKIIKQALPKNRSMLVSLDRILANVERTKASQKGTDLNLDPPPIYYSQTPAILVGFFGNPVLEPIKGAPGLSYVVNTNWDLFRDESSSIYYLLNGDSWLQSQNIYAEEWRNVDNLPALFRQLPDSKQWKSVREKIPGKPIDETPKIITANQPSELIVVDGEPVFEAVVKSRLFYVSNSDADLFFYQDDKKYYFLTAGRWFRASLMEGPWSAASMDLPEIFKKIPHDHDTKEVLYSVPGTPEADIATLLASVPQRATVNRKDTAVDVVYQGTPEFQVVEGTTKLYYATNTAYSVLSVGDSYYCVYNGVWFISANKNGPWIVADSIPAVIYTIPANHPMHNVTYVHVYSATPDTVVVGYTSGYSGNYVAATGVVMFGLGYWLGHNHHYHHHHYYPSHYYAYGGAARYSYNYGGYHRSARYYGPHGGVAGRSGYNPRTGSYYRGGVAAGPNGVAYGRQAYNPHTGRSAERTGARTPYGSWGRTAVSEGSSWARGGHERVGGKTVTGVQTSSGAALVGGYNRNTNQSGVVARDKYGDVYAGRNGDVYKRNKDNWSSASGRTRSSSSVNRDYLGQQSRQRSYGSQRARNFQRSGGRISGRRR